jgi:nitrogen-specific signal transduction histidine kinase
MFAGYYRNAAILVVALIVTCAVGIVLLRWYFTPVDLAEYLDRYDSATAFQVLDLENDGIDEIFLLEYTGDPCHIKAVDAGLKPFYQKNFYGMNAHRELGWIDFDSDSILELAVAHDTPDSFGIKFYDRIEGEINDGKNIMFPHGNDIKNLGHWDGYYYARWTIDADDDGQLEVLIHAHTNTNYQPRALMAYDVMQDSIKWRYDFGTAIGEIQIGDYNGDGFNEILAGGKAFGNSPIGTAGAVNGTDDYHSYIIMLNRHGELLHQRETGGKYSLCSVYGIPYSDDNKSNIFATVTSLPSAADAKDSLQHFCRLISLNGKSGDIKEEIILGKDSSANQQFFVMDPKWGETLGPVTIANDGCLRMYNHDFECIRGSRKYPFLDIKSVVDINDDNSPEFLAVYGLTSFILLDAYFQELAYYAGSEGVGHTFAAFMRASDADDSRLVFNLPHVQTFKLPEIPLSFISAINWWVSGHTILLLTVLIAGFVVSIMILVHQRSVVTRVLIEMSEIQTRPHQGLLVVNSRLRIVFANRKTQQILGLPKKWRWKKIKDILDHDEAVKLAGLLNDTGESDNESGDLTVPLKTAAGVKFLTAEEVSNPPGLDKNLSIYTIQDAREKQSDDIFVNWYEIISRIAHRMKSPLSNTLTSIDLVRGLMKDQSETRNKGIIIELDEASDYLKQSLKMAEKFLRFRLKKVHRENYDLKELIQESADYTILPMDKSPEYVISDCDGGISINTDKELFKELFSLLIHNSAEAVDPRDGRISIICELAHNLQGDNTGEGNILIRVEDNGHGIAEGDLLHIFEPYFTTRQKTFGTGMGLTIAKKICNMLDAGISISSQVGSGTAVEVIFRQ